MSAEGPPHPGLPEVEAACKRIEGVVRPTRVVPSAGLTDLTGVPVWLKLECEQETGSFKLRGAANTLLLLDEAERRRGVVAVSSGNHGRAIAYVAQKLGVAATICLSSRVPEVKVDAIAALEANVVVAGGGQDDADAAARRLVEEQGLVFIHPFDDPRVIAGQGTIGVEMAAELPGARTFVVPLSGGGLIAGIAAAAKALVPGCRVTGVSQDRGPAMYDSLAAGRLVGVVEEDTLADALAGGLGAENNHSFEMCRELVDEAVLVTEDEIAAGMRHLHDEEDLTVEGGGAVGVAALLAGRISPADETVVVVSGGNVAPETLQSVLA